VQAAGFVHGYTTVFWWCTGLFVIGAVVCGTLMRSGPLQGMGPSGAPAPAAVTEASTAG
jgi:hypothetical protein